MSVREVTFEELPGLVGQSLGTSDWKEITQDDVNTFAEVTGDHQWIHIDQERAAKESPYGTTIAHGYFTLSLVSHLLAQVWRATGVKMGVNYGLNKVRFPSPVPVGKRVRAHAALAKVTEIEGGVQLEVDVTIEVEGSEKPACAAQAVFRYYR